MRFTDESRRYDSTFTNYISIFSQTNLILISGACSLFYAPDCIFPNTVKVAAERQLDPYFCCGRKQQFTLRSYTRQMSNVYV